MNRDELAFKILLVILQTDSLRESILGSARPGSIAPAALFARVAWVQADAFIAAGVTDEERARLQAITNLGPPPFTSDTERL